jgi:two-component system nitrogen regulation response regulator NtrX
MVDEGSFREDLLYRLTEVIVRMPPLREHREDVPILAGRILSQIDGPTRTLGPDALAYLCEQSWPGNVRELRNAVRRAAALSGSAVLSRDALARLEHVRPSSRAPSSGPASKPGPLPDDLSLRELRRTMERDYLLRLIGRYGVDLDSAANHAGVHRKSLERLIRQHGLARR